MQTTLELTADAFSPCERLEKFRRSGAGDEGAISAFIGSVRYNTDELRYLEIEAYEKMAKAQLATLAKEAAYRFKPSRLLIVHRVGRLKPGDPIVLAAAGAAHRQATTAACNFVVEALKTDVALWKCEIDRGGNRRWIEPPAARRS